MRNWCHWARQVIGTYAPRWDPLLDQAVQGRLIIQGQPKHLSSWERSPHTGHQIRSEGHTLIPTSMWDCCALKKKKKKNWVASSKLHLANNSHCSSSLCVCWGEAAVLINHPQPRKNSKNTLQKYLRSQRELPSFQMTVENKAKQFKSPKKLLLWKELSGT